MIFKFLNFIVNIKSKILNYLKILSAIFLIIFLFLGLLSIPSIQTFLGEYSTKRINKKFGTDINIKKVTFNFSGEIELNNILVNDHRRDTLIFIKQLKSSLTRAFNIYENKLIFEEINLDGLLFNIKTYKSENKSNINIFAEKFKRNKKKFENSFELYSTNLNIFKSTFILINENKIKSKILNFNNLNINTNDFIINEKEVIADIKNISFYDPSSIEMQNFQSKFKYNSKSMFFEDLNLFTKKSKIFGDIYFNYNKGDLKSFVDKVDISANFNQSEINLEELNFFFNEFGKSKNVILNADILGTLNNIDVLNLDLLSNDGTKIDGNFHFDNLISYNKREFKMIANIDSLSSTHKDLKGILPRLLGQKLPSNLNNLGVFSTFGNIQINDHKMIVDLNIQSELGKVKTDITLDDIDFIDSAKYSGNLTLIDFNLGKLINNRDVGRVDGIFNINGNGFEINNINSKIKGNFNFFNLNNYNYSDVNVFGQIRDKIFKGHINVNDLNADFDFDGFIDFSTIDKIYDFSTTIEHIDLNAINLPIKRKKSIFSGLIKMNMQGDNFNNLSGQLKLIKSKFINENGTYFFEDFLITSIVDSLGIKTIELDSPEIIQGSFVGNFNFGEIQTLVKNSIKNIFSKNDLSNVSKNQTLKFNFKVHDKIIEVLYPNLVLGKNTSFKGILDSDPSNFILSFKSPEIRLNSSIAKNIEMKFNNNNKIFNSFFHVDSLSTSYFNAYDLNMISLVLNDTIHIKSEFLSGNKKEDKFNFNMFHITKGSNYTLGLKPSKLKFKNTNWEFNHDSVSKFNYNFKENTFNLETVTIRHDNEQIILNASHKNNNSSVFNVEFKDVNLEKVTPVIDSLSLGGIINGNIEVSKIDNIHLPRSLLNINNFSINGFNLGDFNADIIGNSSLTNYDVNVNIQDVDKRSFSATGNLDVSGENSYLDLNLIFDGLILNPLNSLGGDALSNIRGKISGKAKISGQLEKPKIDGLLKLDDGGISIPYLNVDYKFDNNTNINLINQSFIFDSANFIDSKFNSKAKLNGVISHTNFTNWLLNTEISTDRLLVLDTNKKEESLYYGRGYVSGDIDISGPTNKLFIEANVSTSKGTFFKIPLNDSEMISENSYIKFINKKEKNNKSLRNVKLDNIKGVEMEFNMDVTDDAEIEIVIDRNNGSSIIGRGNGSILAQINTNDKFQMFGDFLVLNGFYNYSLGKVIQKKFKLVKDGSLLWDGDPLQAEINLQAVYDGINVNPSTLLDNPINQRIPVEVKVNLTGALEKPDLDFDITFPKINSSLNNELKDRLRDKDKRQFQALSLLATGSFRNKIAFDSQDAIELVSDGVTNVLNDIFSSDENKVKLGLDLDIGENTPEYETDSRVGVTLSTKISENILINGKVGVPVGGVSQSTVAGDFEVEVLLNEDRTLSLKFFNRENSIQNFGEQIGYTQGLGLSYNIEFDNLKELLKELFSKNQKEQIERTEEKKQKSSVPDYIEFK